MQDNELYQHSVGLKYPWSVAEVDLDKEDEQINIHISYLTPAGQGTKVLDG